MDDLGVFAILGNLQMFPRVPKGCPLDLWLGARSLRPASRKKGASEIEASRDRARDRMIQW